MTKTNLITPFIVTSFYTYVLSTKRVDPHEFPTFLKTLVVPQEPLDSLIVTSKSNATPFKNIPS